MDQYNRLVELLKAHNIHKSVYNNYGHATLAGNTCLLSASINSFWLLDIGATDHICPNLDEFSHFVAIHNNESHITIPDGRQLKVLHIGPVKLHDSMVLKDVSHVPEFHFKLISIYKMCKDLHCK